MTPYRVHTPLPHKKQQTRPLLPPSPPSSAHLCRHSPSMHAHMACATPAKHSPCTKTPWSYARGDTRQGTHRQHQCRSNTSAALLPWQGLKLWAAAAACHAGACANAPKPVQSPQPERRAWLSQPHAPPVHTPSGHWVPFRRTQEATHTQLNLGWPAVVRRAESHTTRLQPDRRSMAVPTPSCQSRFASDRPTLSPALFMSLSQPKARHVSHSRHELPPSNSHCLGAHWLPSCMTCRSTHYLRCFMHRLVCCQACLPHSIRAEPSAQMIQTRMHL